VGDYDQDKAVAAAARARTSDRQQMRTAAARATDPATLMLCVSGTAEPRQMRKVRS
jgi:hypothetical protein